MGRVHDSHHGVTAMFDTSPAKHLGKFHHDLTSRPNPGIMVNKGNHPQMAQQFRLVKYYTLW